MKCPEIYFTATCQEMLRQVLAFNKFIFSSISIYISALILMKTTWEITTGYYIKRGHVWQIVLIYGLYMVNAAEFWVFPRINISCIFIHDKKKILLAFFSSSPTVPCSLIQHVQTDSIREIQSRIPSVR